MKNTLSYIISGQGVITTILDGKTGQIHPRSPFYDEILVAVKARDEVKYRELSSIKKRLEFVSKARISFVGGAFTLDGKAMHNAMTKRFVRLVEDGHDMEPFMAFIKNCLLNPRQEAIEELYLFLEANDLPLTDDGCFLAYRRVYKDYLSIHANPDGTRNRNMVGDIVTKDRNECNPDRTQTCEKGLHMAGLSYLPHYGSSSNGDKTMIAKINPADVVSVPLDYNNQKLRCCKYEVVAEHFDGDSKDTLSENGVYSVDKSGIKKYSRRDSKTGRFTK
jgi:hypothetical protein